MEHFHHHLHVVLVHPEIPPNTGAIARLCAGTDTVLHLVEPLGFSLEDRYLRRAGLDYWPHVRLVLHPDLSHWERARGGARCFLASRHAPRLYTEVRYRPGDHLVFGRETRGLPERLLAAHPESTVRLPQNRKIRSQNLANAVSAILYEAIRQIEGLG
ncbi:MAG: tRNA (cytidine(34)-2'-O)-methyltransferase [Nitrospirae bacterium]|nr:MAG: tRNA (cytidine(34)-2'-O)-methyltransferase [Nitrospirota bacterium]